MVFICKPEVSCKPFDGFTSEGDLQFVCFCCQTLGIAMVSNERLGIIVAMVGLAVFWENVAYWLNWLVAFLEQGTYLLENTILEERFFRDNGNAYYFGN